LNKAQKDNKLFKHEAQLTVGLNSYLAAEIEPSYSFMFHKNIGIIAGLRGVMELVDDLHYPLTGGPAHQWKVYDKKKASTILFRPAARVRFPIVGDYLFLHLEPGILLNMIPNETIEFAYINTQDFEPIPSRFEKVKNKGGETLFFDMKSYITMQIDNLGVSLGYGFSTFDIYSGRRNIVIQGDPLKNHLSKKKNNHAGFLGVSYYF